MKVTLEYAHPTTLATTLDEATLACAANRQRLPVRFSGWVKQPFLLRQLLLAMQDVIRSDFTVQSDAWTLDPVITVHPDQICFEAFSSDVSSYARLVAPLEAFDVEGQPQYGTTNIDFTWNLREAVQQMRSSRRTLWHIGAAGFAVTTGGAATGTHFERKVEIPESWLTGFLQVQGALTMRPFLFDVRPVDLLTVIAFLTEHKPPRPPHGLRYEFTPGAPIRLVVEPWDEPFPLHGTHYDGYPRHVRVWGRRRLALLQDVLPHAQRVTIGVLGRGLPHLYICHCQSYIFVLVLSGWTQNDWSTGAALAHLAPSGVLDAIQVERVHAALAARVVAPRRELAAATGLSVAEVEQALFQLCRAGRVMFDPLRRQYRQRELFAEPLETAGLFATDERLSTAQRLLEAGRVTLQEPPVPAAGTERRHEQRALATVHDDTAYAVTVALDLNGRLRFGRCTCPFFQDNMLARGPCVHILAARLALEQSLRDAAEATTMRAHEEP